MLLYVVRHAIAAERDPESWPDDRGRPLTKAGSDRFGKSARGIAALVPTVDHVLSSPLVRCWQTAEILGQRAEWPAPTASDALEPGRPPSDVLLALESYAAERAVALVGHEPNLKDLASYLLTGEVGRVQSELKKGGMACLSLEHGLQAGTARLVWWMTPKVLRALG